MAFDILADDNSPAMSRFRNLYQGQKPEISIALNTSSAGTYTTGDQIEGVVSIAAPQDLSFEDIEIEFVGTSRTYVERLTTAAAVSGRSEAFHQFLKLQQPGLDALYPTDRVLKAGQKYDFPFVFVIPAQLLPRTCQHLVISPSLRDAHLQLPPSFGDKDTATKSGAPDDMVPIMASVRYGVFTRISRLKVQGDSVTRSTVASKAKRLRVIPTATEQPPLDVSGDDPEYVMRKEKTVRKGVLKGKLGTLVVETTQAPSVRLPARGTAHSESTAMAAIMLRFDPADEKSPVPRLGNLATRLKVNTYFASTARANFPSKQLSIMDITQGVHTEHLNLSSRCMANVEWTKHDPSKPTLPSRRDSGYSLSSASTVPEPSSTYKGKCFYVAQLLVPITLPAHKTFVPTFHTCLISRIYQLKLELSIPAAGMVGTVGLKAPLQISCEPPAPGDAPAPHRGSASTPGEVEIDDDDVSDFFEPRTIRPPSDQFVGRSRIGSQAPVDEAPPGYTFLSPTSGTRDRVIVY